MTKLITEAFENRLRQSTPPSIGWRSVFGRVRPGSTRDVDRRIRDLRAGSAS